MLSWGRVRCRCTPYTLTVTVASFVPDTANPCDQDATAVAVCLSSLLLWYAAIAALCVEFYLYAL